MSELTGGAAGDVAVITGGAGGIGFALAQAYAQRGARVLIADRDLERLAAAAERLAATGAEVHHHRVDLVDEASVDELAAFAGGVGRIGALCLNAGITSSGPTTWNTSPATFDAVIGVNLRGLFNSIRSFVPGLVAQGGPASIVITASMAGLVASGYSAVYAASKAGAVALAKALRDELANEAPAVSVALLCPGVVRTDLMRTSSAVLTGDAAMDPTFADIGHQALNEAGVAPHEAARWALDALDEGRFWAVPPAGDGFTELLRAELATIEGALGAPSPS